MSDLSASLLAIGRQGAGPDPARHEAARQARAAAEARAAADAADTAGRARP